MAGKLLKENIPVERLVGQGSAQATAETSVMLSGGDRNVSLVSCRACRPSAQWKCRPGASRCRERRNSPRCT